MDSKGIVENQLKKKPFELVGQSKKASGQWSNVGENQMQCVYGAIEMWHKLVCGATIQCKSVIVHYSNS